jgi:electron transfer flavoprotein beta subunit
VSSATGPLVVACLRHADPAPEVDALTGAVRPDPVLATTSAADRAALELALRVAAAWHGRVLAVAAGPSGAEATLRDAAAAGASPLRVPWPPPGGTGDPYLTDLAADGRALAAALAAAIRTVAEPALVICGDRSADRGTGTVPAFLAAELGAAQALGLVELSATATATELRAVRRLDRGRREELAVSLPAVCSVEAAGIRLRRAGLTAALAAASRPIPVAVPAVRAAADPARTVVPGTPRPPRPRTRPVRPPAGDTPRERLLALTGAGTERTPPTVLGPVGAAEAADALLAFLTRHGYRPPAQPG